MKLELQDEKGSTGVFIELPLEQLRAEIGLASSSVEPEAKLKEDKDTAADLEGKPLVDQVSKWVDTRVIAEMVVDHLKAEGLPVTLDQAKAIWLDTLETLGSHLAEVGKLAGGMTMDDFTPAQKADFVLTWGRGLSSENKAIFAKAIETPLAEANEAAVAEAEAKGEAVVEEFPRIIQGKTDKPGYKYLELLNQSIREE